MTVKDTILVLTNSLDGIHSEVVISKLRNLGEKVFRLDVDRIDKGVGLVLGIDTEKFECIVSDGTDLSLEKVKSVWYRRPARFNVDISDQLQKNFVEDELAELLSGIWLSLDNCFWLPNPHHLERASKKIWQLTVAKQIGLKTPRTIFTNDPERVLKFYKECKGRVVHKTLKRTFLNYDNRGFRIPVTLVTPKHLKQVDLVRKAPSFFQEYVEKEYDARITVVGRKVFAVRIDSQSHPLTAVDWRQPELIDKIPYSKIELPQATENLVLTLLDRLGLNFGALDFAVNPKGEYIFLEVNPTGQWYWLEHLTGALISDAICDILSSAQPKGGEKN